MVGFNLSEVGTLVTGNSVVFSTYLPNIKAPAFSVSVLLIKRSDQFDKNVKATRVDLQPYVPADNTWGQLDKGMWRSAAIQLAAGESYLYRYEVTGPSKDGSGLVRSLYFADPFARETASGVFSVLTMGQHEFVWKESEKFKVPWITDAIIYELDVQEFNYTFDGITARLPYLKSLGINAIELLPITGVAEPCNWGYAPIFYFAPEERYGGPHALKRMVQACHHANIAVVMDLVLPHSDGLFSYEKAYERFFDLWFDDRYYDQATGTTKYSPNPVVSKHSRFGHKKDFRMASVQQFAEAICKFWIEEYHIDGFRLDHVNGLMDHAPSPDNENADWDHYRPTFTSLQALSKSVYSFSKGFARFQDGGRSRVLQIVEDLNEGAYQLTDTAASAVNGCWEEKLYQDSTDMAVWDCLNGHYFTELLMQDPRWANFTGSKTVDGDSIPVSPVYYNNCHDKSYLMYRIDRRKEWESQSFDYPSGTENMAWYKLQPYAIALLTGVGTPMVWMAEDMAESYGLPSDGPSRVRGARFVHWENFYTPYATNVASPVLPLTTLYRNLCRIRNTHPALRGPRTNAVIEIQDFGRKAAVFRRWLGQEIIVVAINFSNVDVQLTIPFGHQGRWVDILSACNQSPADEVQVSGCDATVSIPSNFGRIYKLS